MSKPRLVKRLVHTIGHISLKGETSKCPNLCSWVKTSAARRWGSSDRWQRMAGTQCCSRPPNTSIPPVYLRIQSVGSNDPGTSGLINILLKIPKYQWLRKKNLWRKEHNHGIWNSNDKRYIGRHEVLLQSVISDSSDIEESFLFLYSHGITQFTEITLGLWMYAAFLGYQTA